ncbi:biotin--[acetyl-CoA-carboxylase] ligase [Halomonas sp. ML-15]|uniref:biotin--[acetyl-CoA-carboxylase] ligase n=1 Tax=Halomonas sp. ML-15 TaxID=2773305 RepID=UPI0017479CC7|nr:biotin--[acetyl-CoA-carboxylase] ligase [Halomonas sp. ML-15]MBD3898044.1 biotin--[acetyl-CoA-carboxylase] ligase [Halomonas sp. ML-15]
MTIGDLIRLMRDGEFHSGEQLGERLGVSRTAVWKQLKKLEGVGVPLETVKGLGYRLAAPLELFDGADIVARLPHDCRTRLSRLIIEDNLPSTNAFLRARFEQGAGHGEACLAEAQSAGRGRRGRGWETPWGRSVVLSVGWRFEGGASVLEGLSLAVGVVLAEVLERHGLEVALKWPNDVLLKTPQGLAKLAGILLEVSGDLAGPCEVVVGVGLNVDLPDEVRARIEQPVGAVHDVVPELSRNQLASELVAGLLDLLSHYEEQGFGAWQQAWERRHAYANQKIDVIQHNARYVAQAEGIDEAGNLLVRHDGELRRLAGGEISVRVRS